MGIQDLQEWFKRWQENDIDFHQSDINYDLQNYVSQTKLGSHVLVPLCGKSTDMLWLAKQGFKVFGVEISEQATKQFFEDNKLEYQLKYDENFTQYISQTFKLKVLQGDFFKLNSVLFKNKIDWVYDRACLIAFNQNQRIAYAKHLNTLCSEKTKMLSICLEKRNDSSGPPYTVLQKETVELFKLWNLEKVEEYKKSEDLKKKVYCWVKK